MRDGRVAIREPFVRDKASGYASLSPEPMEEETFAGRILRHGKEGDGKNSMRAPHKCNASAGASGESIPPCHAALPLRGVNRVHCSATDHRRLSVTRGEPAARKIMKFDRITSLCAGSLIAINSDAGTLV